MQRLLAHALLLSLAITALPASLGQVEVEALPVTVSQDVAVPFPASAQAQGAGVETAVRSEPVAAPMAFSMVGFELPDGVDELRVRTSPDGEDWGPWATTGRFDAEDGPDPDSQEATEDRSHRYAEPVWVEEGRYLQVELPAELSSRVGELRAELIDSRGLSGGPVERRIVPATPAAAAASDRPAIISRSQWGADESLARSTRAANRVHGGVLHHTATANNYTDARAVMRAMYRYHTVNLGWADLGYNLVVDQQGNVYEGRAGGLERGIIGAHASGYNTGTFGVSVIGNFDQIRPPQAAVDAVSQVIGWQSRIHGIDPQGWTNQVNGTWQRTIIGHRDVGSTACPGAHLYPRLDEIRRNAATAQAQPAPGPAPIVAPRTTITAGPSGTVTANTATLSFSASGDVSFFECEWQGGAWYPCASTRTFTGLTDGNHTFRVRAVDRDGNRESPPASRSWRVVTPMFSDVAGSAHLEGIGAVAAAGITTGYRDGTFRPRGSVTREQMATFLMRALQLDAAS